MEGGRAERDAILRQQIQVMPPDRFEQLVFELARLDDPSVRRLVHPDGGADTLRPATDGQAAEVWQAKRYPATINWQECEASLVQAIDRWQPSRVTFAFARDFSDPVQRSFDDRLVKHERAAETNTAVSAWTLSELVRRLDENQDIKIRYFGDGQEGLTAKLARTIEAGGALEGGADLVERAKSLSTFAEQQDIDFTYQVVSGSAESPAAKWSDLPYVVIDVGDERTRVQVATWVRNGAEVQLPNVWFTDDEAGQRARSEAVAALARGDAAEVTEGLRLRLQAPQLMRDFVPDPTGLQGSATLSPGAPTELELEVATPEGTIVRRLEMRPVPPRPGVTAAFAAFSGAALIELSFTLLEEPTISANIACSAHFGTSAAENADAAELMYAVLTHTNFTLRSRVFFPESGALTGTASALRDHPQLAELQWRRDFYADVALLERALGVELPIPAELTALNIDEVSSAAAVLRTGEGTATFEKTEGFVRSPSEIPGLPDAFAAQKTIRRMVTYDVLGQPVNLGLADYEVPRLKVVDVIPHGQTADSPARVVLEAASDTQMRFRLVDGAVLEEG